MDRTERVELAVLCLIRDGDRAELANISAVDDLAELLKVFDDPELTEFQYVVDGENWTALIR